MSQKEFPLTNWLSSVLGIRKTKDRRRNRRRAHARRQWREQSRLGLESLEERRLLATLSFDTNSNTLIYSDPTGEVNNVQYTFRDLGNTKEFTFSDTALIINGTACGAAAGNTITCSTLPQTASVRFQLGLDSDTLVINGSQIAAGNAGAEDIAIGPSGAGQRVTGLNPGVPVDITGTEIIRFVGNGSDDSLTVNPGSGNDTVRLQNANPNTDVVISSSLPNIEFTGLAAFQLNANAGAGNGADTITFETRDLEGATASNYSVATDGSDMLTIEGQAANDNYAIDAPDGAGPQAIRIRDANGNGVQVTATSTNLGLLQVNTLGGADTLDVDVTDLSTPIQYNGGDGTTDSLNLTGSGITNETYMVGPSVDQGTFVFDSSWMLMFTGLEPITDWITATNLTVNGTPGANAFSYSASGADGLVAVDAFESLRFNNKQHLILNGSGANDTFDISTANGLDADGGTITINGGDNSDTVTVHGSSVQDHIAVENLGTTGARITGAQAVPIVLAAAETLWVDGDGGNDALTIHGTNTDDVATLTTGFPINQGTLLVNSLLAVNYRDIGSAGSLTFAAGQGTNDRLVYNGTLASDAFVVSGSTGTVGLSNAFGTYPQVQQTGVEQLDLLGLDADDSFSIHADQPYSRLNITGGNGTSDTVTLNGNSQGNATVTFGGAPAVVSGAGLGTVSLPGIETVNLNNTNSGVIINGGGTTFNVTPTSTNTATVVVDSGTPQIQLEATSLTIDGQGGADDLLTVNGTGGDDQAVVTPGASTDAGSIAVNSLLPVDFLNLGAGGVLLFAAAGGTDELVYNGTDSEDAFQVTNTGDVRLTSDLGPHLVVRETGAEDLKLNGLDGDDSFTIANGHGFGSVTVSGGNPASGSDAVTLNGDGSPVSVTLGVSPATVVGGGLGNVSLPGIEAVTVNNLVGNVQIDGSASANAFDVTPLDFDTVVVQADGGSPTAIVNTFGTLTVNAAGSTNNTLSVHLSAAGETVTVDDNEVTVTAGAVLKSIGYNNANLAAVTVMGKEGNDTFNVTSSVNSPEIRIDGGDPIGVVGDTINYTPPAAVTFAVGPEGDEGGFESTGIAGVSYDHIEAVNVNLANAGGVITICGTGDADQITAVGIAPGTVDVQVNDGAVNRFTNATTINLEGKNGDDQIDIDLIPNLGVTFNVDGGLPTVHGDELTVTGTDAADTASWTPSGSDSGTLVAVGTTVNVTAIEDVTYDGRDGGDTLSVTGTPLDDSYTYAPAGVGKGGMTSDGAPAFAFLGVDNLTVTGGAGGFDSLVVTTTDAADIITSDADTVMLAGGGVATLGAGMNRIELYTLGGHDQVDLDLQLAGVQKFIDAGDGDDSVDLSGALDAEILGGSGNDLLIGSPLADTIIGGAGDDTIQGGAGNDRLDGGTGDDTLQGGTGSDTILGGDDSDTVIWNNGDGSDLIEGGTGNDVLVVNGDAINGDTFVLRPLLNPPPTGTRVILERTNLTTFQLDVDAIEAFEVQGGGGADSLSVQDLFETDAQTVLFNAGGGADVDSLTVAGRNTADDLHLNNTAGVLTLEGLTYDVVMIQGNAAEGDTVTINAGDGDDTIDAGPGVNLLALLTFNGDAGNDTLLGSTGNDTLNGGADHDVINGRGGTDTVDGGSGGDTILTPGTSGNDTITMGLTAAGSLVTNVNGLVTTYQAPGAGPIANAGMEQLEVNGLAGNDSLIVDETNGLVSIPITYHGEDGNDQLTAVNGVGVAATYNVGPTVDAGSLVHVAGAVTQTIHFTGLEPVIDLSAGTLTVNATDADNAITYSQSDLNPAWGKLAVDGFEPIHFASKTSVTINAGAGSDAISIANSSSGFTGSLIINGGDPSDGDSLLVNNAATGTLTIAVNTGIITNAGPVSLSYNGMSAINVNSTASTIATPLAVTGSAAYVVNAAAAADAGQILTDAVPVAFQGIGAGSTINLTGTAAADDISVNGTGADETISVAGNSIAIGGRATITATSLGDLTLGGLDGEDSFHIAGGHAFATIDVQGGDPINHLDLDAATAGVFVNLDAAQVTGFGGIVSYSGVAHMDVDANNQTFRLDGGVGDDTIRVTPSSANSGMIQANSAAPVVSYSAVGGNAITVNGAGGEDTLEVVGNETAEVFLVTDSSVTVGAQIVNFTAEALSVDGQQGVDIFHVTAGAIPIFIDGGDPIGAGDEINLAASGPFAFNAGPENDEGTLQDGNNQLVSFDHLEGVNVNLNGFGLTISGTNGDDDITLIGTGNNAFDVTINDGLPVSYANAGNVLLDGLHGDDDIDIDLNAFTLTGTLTARGNQPATGGGDTLTIAGAAGSWAAGGPDGGVFTVDAEAIVVDTMEQVVFDGAGTGTLNVVGTTAANTIVHRPGTSPDAGSVQVDDLLGVAYTNAGSVTVDGGGANDLLEAWGTAAADVFGVAGTATITLNDRIHLNSSQVEAYRLRGLGGDDTFNIAGGSGIVIDVDGDEPGSGSDVLNYTQAAAATLDLGNAQIDEPVGGAAELTYTGIETINVASGSFALTVEGSSLDDTISVSPLDGDDVQLQMAGGPVINANGSGTLMVDPLTGNDLIALNGSDGSDAVNVTDTTLTIAGRRAIAYVAGATEAVSVQGKLGDDTILIQSGVTTPVFADGGDGSDTVAVLGADNARITQDATPTSGLIDNLPNPAANVDYANMELASLTGTGALTVRGTDAADEIAIGTGGANRVWVNSGTVVEFNSYGAVNLEGRHGDDRFSIHPLAGVAITAQGMDPAASDHAVVHGTAAGEAITYTPDSLDTSDPGQGTIQVGGFGLITVQSMESLTIDGLGGGDDLLVRGLAGRDNRFLHAPGDARDKGVIEVSNGVNALLRMSYENLGANGEVNVDGVGGTNTLAAVGTDRGDLINGSFTGPNAINLALTTVFGAHVPLRSANVANYQIGSLEGDDVITLNSPLTASGVVQIFGGGPGADGDTLNLVGQNGVAETVTIAPDGAISDVQTVTGLSANPLQVTGIETIAYDGGDDQDTLVVDPGAGDNTVRVERGDDVDVVTSDSLPMVEFSDVAVFRVDASVGAGSGADSITFATRSLAGATNTSYQLNANATDALIIEGLDGDADDYTLTNPTGTPVLAVRDNAATLPVTVTVVSNELGRVQVNTLGGDDLVTVDVEATRNSDLIRVPITFDGGSASDTLVVTGNPVTSVSNVLYAPGPATTEGRLTYNNGAMTIDFSDLEPVIDTVVATNLTVQGTDGDNAITYTERGANGLVTVDAFESIEFANKGQLTLNGGAGDDTITLDAAVVPPGPLASIVVAGGNSTSGDRLRVVNSNGTQIDVTPTNFGANITGAQLVPVTASTIESLMIDGDGSNDVLNVITPAGASTIQYTPGGNVNDGRVAVDSRLAVDFENLGGGSLLSLSDPSGSPQDTLVYRGSDVRDVFSVGAVAGVGNILLTNSPGAHVPVRTPGVSILTLEGLAGDDLFNVSGDQPYDVMNIRGGDPDDADVLALTSPSGAPAINLGSSLITGYGTAINYRELETINANAGAGALSVVATAGDDTVTVTPGTASSGVLQANANDPMINYSNTGTTAGNVLSVNPSSGQDTLIVNATSSTDTVTVHGVNQQVNTGANGGLIEFIGAETESLAVNGLEGDDTFNVTPAANLEIFIDGGDPIGVTGDRLNLFATTSSLFLPGPEADEGGFVLDSLTAVSYDHIEAISVTDPSGNNLQARVCGTNGDDDITAQGVAPNQVDVSVNEGPMVRYNGVAALSLEGKNGDDDIDVDLQVPNLGVAITADGGLPGVRGDVLTVTGVDNAADTVLWVPTTTTTDAGTLTVSGQTINVVAMEELVFDGEADNAAEADTVTVQGPGRFVHTPGDASDAGNLALGSLLDIDYVNIGNSPTNAVIASGTSGSDTLVALAGNGSDAIAVTLTADNAIDVDISDAHGTHVDLRSTSVENYEIRSLEGDDDITLNAAFNVTGSFSVFAGGPGAGSDTFGFSDPAAMAIGITPNVNNSDDQWISGIFTGNIALSGVERIHYDGNGVTGETLTINPGLGDNQVLVQRSSNTAADLVTSDSLPDIEFENVNIMAVDVTSAGADVVTFATWSLAGAVPANYRMAGLAADALVIQGVNGGGAANDDFTITNPAAGPVAVTDNGPATPVVVTATNAALGRLQINTLGGDDEVTVNVNGTNLISTPITFDGGGNSDTLYLTGTPAVATAGAYSPGAAVTEGRLRYVEQASPNGVMTIDFLNLEPVIDDTVGTLTVNGTDANNAIDYRPGASGRGTVSVDGFERIDFRNKSALTIDAMAGDDVITLNHPSPAPAGLAAGTITVIGGGSTTGDNLVVNGSNGTDAIGFTPTAKDAATISGVQGVTAVLASTVESVVINGLGDNSSTGDTLTVNTPAGTVINPVNSSVELTPGTTLDSGTIQVDTLVPMRFLNLSSTGSVQVADPDSFDNDRLVYNGSESRDAFVVPDPRVAPGTPSIAKVRYIGSIPFLQVPVTSNDIENYTLRGHGGNDVFDVTPQVGVNIRVEGDEPGAEGDVLNFDAEAAAVGLNLETSTLSQAGFGNVIYNGVEVVNVDANSQNLAVTATAGDDWVEVTPTGTNAGNLQANGIAPLVNFSETGTFAVDTAGGNNTLVVNGSSAAETIVVTDALVTVGSRETVNYSSTGGQVALTVNGHEGRDTFQLTPGTVPMFIDGGDPIGISGDRLAITVPAAGGLTTFAPGPEGDEGGFEFAGATVDDVSYDHIEATSVNVSASGGGALVCGTGDDDQITAAGVAVGAMDVTVNNSAPVSFTGLANLELQGKNGDDDIDIDLNVTGLGVAITANGGLPSTDGDSVTVTGVNGVVDPARWTPSDVDAGTLVVSGQTITVLATESLTYDGESDDETLTVMGDGSNILNEDQERFIHTPGQAADAGSIAISTPDDNVLSSNDTLLGISYVNLGLDGGVTINGGPSTGIPDADTLVLLGTGGDDVLNVDFTGADAGVFDLRTVAGDHIDVSSVDIENYELRTLDGDDDVNLTALIDASGTFAIHAGGPSGSDSVNFRADDTRTESVVITPDAADSDNQRVSGLLPTANANSILVSGAELITLDGGNDADTLTVDPGAGDNWVRVERGQGADLVSSDSLPNIEFENLATFAVNAASAGADVVTFVTESLNGAIPANYQLTGTNVDTLVIEGVDGSRNADDAYTVTNPAGAASVAVTDGRVTVTETLGDLGRLQIDTLGGDDEVLVNVGATDLVRVPITFDGGLGSDLLTVSGTPATAVTNVTYRPGPDVTEGRLTYDAAMTIDFVDLEPVIDLVPAANLTVMGTDADNAIDYRAGSVATRGLVSVDAFETIEFSFKDQLTINAGAGEDVINLNNPNLPTGNANASLGEIEVNGGDSTIGDVVIINGTAAANTIQFSPLAPDAADVTGVQAATLVDVNETESVVINGLASDDTLAVNTPAGANNVTYTPGPKIDSGDVRVDSLVPLSFTNLNSGGVLRFTDPGGRVDTLIHRGSDVNDVLTVAATTGNMTLQNTPGTHVVVETTGVANLVLDGLGGDDSFNINGLHPFNSIDVNGQEPSASDVLNVTGTTGAETIAVNLEPATITGFGSVANELIRFTGIEHVNLYGGGGAGVDTLTVNGTQDDDILTYEPIEAQDGKFFNDGSNTKFLFRNIAGTFTVAGGDDGADDVIVLGTNDHDVITVDSPNRVVTVEDTFGVNLKPVTLALSVEDLNVQARDGDDTILVIPAPPESSSVDGIPRNLLINVDGGSPSASDALVIAQAGGANLASTDFVVVSHSRRFDEGVVRVYRDATGIVGDQTNPLLITPPVRFPDIGFVDVEIVSPHVANPAENRLILGPDLYEQNEALTDAKFLGSGETINVQELAIFPPVREHRFVPEDEDWFEVVAQKTGTLDFQVSFHEYNPELLPQGGNLYIEVYDVDGDLVAGYGPNFGSNDQLGVNIRDNDERIRIPVTAGQTYHLRVFGADNPTQNPNVLSTVVNGYNLTIINTAPDVPYDLELADIVATSTAAAGSTMTTVIGAADPSLSGDDDFYNGKYLYFTSGQQAARRALVTDYVAATRTFTLQNMTLSAAPAAGDSFVVETHDSGRSQLDNVTRDDTPVIRFRLDDGLLLHDLPGNAAPDSPTDEVIPIPFNTAQTRNTTVAGYRVPIFIEGPPQHAGAQLPQVPVGYARQLAEGVYEFDFGRDAIDLNNPNGPATAFSLASNNGSYFISSRVEIIDPATPTQTAFGARSTSLEIVVDTATPPLFFGDPQIVDDGLMPGSDSGVTGQLPTFADSVTNVTKPEFWGIAEADSVVRLYVDRNADGLVDGGDVFIGESVAVPMDGTNQFPDGQWNIRSTVDMNNPDYFTQDGVRRILAVAEDPAGNLTPAQQLNILVDTQGPRVTSVFVTTVPGYDLFDPKPSTDGPTPPVTSLSITVSDLAARSNLDPEFLYPALVESIAEQDGNISLKGDHVGFIMIDGINFIADTATNGSPATGTIVLTFAKPLPDDRYTLTVFDQLVDPVGNALDGETDTFEPEDNPTFASGDGVPGGDFVARFTVDSRPEIATTCCGGVYIDANGNMVFDPEGQDNDATNRDFVYVFAYSGNAIFAGDFAPAAAASSSGFDKVGAYGYIGGQYKFVLDFDHDGDVDFTSVSGIQVNGIPVAGDFAPAHPGDEIGLFDGTTWYLDSDGDNILEATDQQIVGTMQGLPIVGDFNGDGQDDLGTFIAGKDTFYLDYNRDGSSDATVSFGFAGLLERPVAGDLNLDGVDDLGLWVPYRSGQIPEEAAEWYFLVSDSATGTFNPYSPAPLGNDLFAMFGDDYALPVFGNFDPPVVPAGEETPAVVKTDTNILNAMDVNGDGKVSALDALVLINGLNDGSARNTLAPQIAHAAPFYDVNGDAAATPQDVLNVINYLNARPVGPQAEGEAAEEVAASLWQPALVTAAAPVVEAAPVRQAAPQVTEPDAVDALTDQYFLTAELEEAALVPAGGTSDELTRLPEVESILDEISGDVAGQWSE